MSTSPQGRAGDGAGAGAGTCSRVLEEAHEAGQGIWVGLLRDFEAYERVVAGEMEKQTEV